MNRSLRLAILLAAAISIYALAGCGGGSSGGSGAFSSISGRVVLNPSGRAAAPITVSVEGTNLSSQVGADSSFKIDHVPPGLHTLVAHGTATAAAIVVEVQKGTDTNVGDVALRDAGQISGLVTDVATKSPVVGALVTISEIVPDNTATEVPHPVRGARTDANGSYTLSGLPVGDYLVAIHAQGFLSVSLSLTVSTGATTTGDAALQSVPAGQTGTMAGNVTVVADDGTQQPAAGVLVRLAPNGDPLPMRPLPAVVIDSGKNAVDFYPGKWNGKPPSEYYTYTDPTGAYKLDGVPAGDYTAVAVRCGLDVDSKPVTISASSTAKVDFQLRLRRPATGKVTGTVSDAQTNQPISGASVNVVFQPSPPWLMHALGTASAGSGSSGGGSTAPGFAAFIPPDGYGLVATTDAQGHYELTAPPGHLGISAAAAGYSPTAVEIDVKPGTTVTADIALKAGTIQQKVTVSGTVYTLGANGNRTVVPGAVVQFAQDWGPLAGVAGIGFLPPVFQFTTKADAQGKYSLTVAPGTYFGFAATSADRSILNHLDIQADTTVDFTIVAGGGGGIPPPPGG